MSKPKPSDESKASEGLQMLGGRDPQIGKEAAVYVGHMKGYQGDLLILVRILAQLSGLGITRLKLRRHCDILF